MILNKMYILIPKCDDCNIIYVPLYINLMLEFSNTVHVFTFPALPHQGCVMFQVLHSHKLLMITHWNF